MGKEVNRIRINRLYSENNIFDPIPFHDGINIILGEKYDEDSIQGRKTNGVGKSLCIEFLDFCMLREYKSSRIEKIPENVFPLDEKIMLDMDVGEDKLTVIRCRIQADSPVIIRNQKVVSFHKLQDARDYLTELIYLDLGTKKVPSYRNLFSILMRDERSEFTDIIKCNDLRKRIPDDFSAHLFLLGLSVELYSNILDTVKELDNINTVIKKNKDELTDNGNRNETFDSMETEIIALENSLEELRARQKVLRHDYEKINDMPKPEQIDDHEIELVYNQYKADLGEKVVKSLNEVIGFKNKVENFQRVILNQKAKEIEAQLKEIAEQIRILDEEYSEKLKLIDEKGVLKNLKTSLKIYEAKKDAVAHTKYLFDEYEKSNMKKRQIISQKTQMIVDLDNNKEQNQQIINSFKNTILEIHKLIMGNKECSFDIQIIDKTSSKMPIKFDLRIFDDGSHSVDRTKVFIYDMAMLFNQYTRERHPLFLVHDNIFDVDQDTLVQCLNYLYKMEEQYQDFQYILTLNRDKIENEERQKMINMDIEEHRVAVFTKENKFLKKDYQEQRK